LRDHFPGARGIDAAASVIAMSLGVALDTASRRRVSGALAGASSVIHGTAE
jgi:hypothetical protein